MNPNGALPERTPLILVVDDETTQRLLTVDCLRSEGFLTQEAENGDAALAIMRANPPDAVLLDVVMPGRDGFAICQEIRSDPTLSETPVLLVTGREDDESIRHAFTVRANDFITKPVLWTLLPHRLRFVLRTHRLQRDLRAALTSAEAASNAKTQLLANVSHELRTPLNAILGFSEMMDNDQQLRLSHDTIREFARDIHCGASKLLTMVNNLLDIARLESDMVAIRGERQSLQDIAAQAVRKLASQADEKAITLVNEIDDDAPEIRADERRMIQILVNLLSNAVAFSDSGAKVELSFELVDEGRIAISVADTGPGIPAEDLPKIMETFRQLDGGHSRQHEGAGLGIPIARALARLHGGELTYESQQGEGTTARLLLPADRVVGTSRRAEAAS